MNMKSTLKRGEDAEVRVAPPLSENEFAKLGDGHVAYIKTVRRLR
jgi:hypothetical protein